jgi:hypothetical protein
MAERKTQADRCWVAGWETPDGQFYFYVRSNGRLRQDERGRHCGGQAAALEYAVKSIPALLRKSLQGGNSYVSTQVCDDQDRTIAVIRTTLIVEKMERAAFCGRRAMSTAPLAGNESCCGDC